MAKRKSKNSRVVYTHVRDVNWVLCLVMSIIFGIFGVDRFIMGKIGTGILKLITLGGIGVWWIVDIVLVASKYNFKDVNWID